ncbi:Regulatory protein, LuxR:Response regulator receiver [Euzebya pacifica]|jgi:DNA-binding NarL/FixJ family response regulator|uniref:Regulatory protein, LuxR:Response regulator receiver n=1 Tax=Euzebya pacifica TaxID=1608957 RepID=A0A346XTQ2_9ACTN|nr:response regulator transcription factor [Euzebya pacifica]AXV05599.1 Regulatory protein, LuxR:Response regulator receiver [Euzebya pacifica]
MTEEETPTRVMLVDDHEVVRQGLKALVESTGEMEVVAQAGTVAEAVLRARSYHPDVIVMDVRLPDGSGVEACRDIRAEDPTARVLMLTSFSDDKALFDSIMAGAAGYVLKQIRGHDLLDGIRRVAAGESLLDPAVTAQVLERIRNPRSGDPRLARLTPTERRILDQIAVGSTNRQIGDELGLAEKTIKNYVSTILSKLQVVRRAEAAAYLVAHRDDS